ncbi:STAS/SEC14 domain-containing protein [Pseudoalteromonas piscicida]|uniref:STAS/SEC14 domain-containing protein n=1 Tax=Pseudoalteromonas piscicida TaxID=43662 RepID=A0A2A5JU30_PSEO7|nr:STAS/SEC14 domain-containing protein [Pseudoalteromonas piscicida]PCK32982.1 STAS/SEC14 domain-containing protein [Pseudoalteromonas piscicida]
MANSFHGISIGTERHGDDIYLTLKPTGKLTHEDYVVITPIIEGALKAVNTPKIYAFVDATEFDGWEPRAMWDDFKLAFEHSRAFVKVAIYGGQNWHRLAATVGNWFVTGEVKYFEDKQSAIQWLNVRT